MFSVDLDHAGYVVVEVAIYPENKDLELVPRAIPHGADNTAKSEGDANAA